MSIGLGIFLGSVFLGTVFLYIKTRDHWNWCTIWKRFGLAALSLIALLVIAIAIPIGYEKWQERPQVVTSLEGLSLGEKLSDVVFRFGKFKEDPLEESQQGKSDGSERYTNDEKRIVVYVLGGLIERVIYLCKSDIDYTSVSKIRCGDAGEEVLSRFGRGVRVQCQTKMENSADELMRVYDIPDFGVRYFLHKNIVVGFSAMDKRRLEGATGINWGGCS